MKQSLAKLTLPTGTKIPNHIAIIPDGNRRWARARGRDTLLGHKAGFDMALKLAKAAREFGVHTLTFWAFSTENWDRTPREINYLMGLYAIMVEKHRREAKKDNIRIVHIGRKDRIPASLAKQIAAVEEETKNNTKHIVNICLDHGGRDDIVRGVNNLIEKVRQGETVEAVTEKNFLDVLGTHDQPYPLVDLLIRTSGEQRTSGYLLYQSAYAEMYFETVHFPDFTPEKLRETILDYSRRRRRFGGNDEEKHLTFNPRIVAGLEFKWHHALDLQEDERLRDLVFRYLKEHYKLSKQSTLEAGIHLTKALLFGRKEDWHGAKEELKNLYHIVQKTLHLAFEPDIIASLEIALWQDRESEEKMRTLLAEKFRISELQATKSAHLAVLAQHEFANKNYEKAEKYLVGFYELLKEETA
ncbi:MAG: polyprenyl diphosphate synthase [Patescibacteria group bacterium]|jgi:undecaprenyl diphosphate synthase